eukprot:CAMPEP_0202778564 /NCGR_PEP_ID=MMETSP1388-20130828/54943_1 /ASSEMBLY_ACC=CAM_ASM_000864 /TAXON_ID=37098 /ORGANISM="Isochrysis sp, Strain CCMP1244" /LENGTH=98 /DNA_ID=CAMNT_0049447841 /DNA_START=112 /DNA_END=404 /DNA_ORIENTATION=+
MSHVRVLAHPARVEAEARVVNAQDRAERVAQARADARVVAQQLAHREPVGVVRRRVGLRVRRRVGCPVRAHGVATAAVDPLCDRGVEPRPVVLEPLEP